jgi:hypothetical protein
MNQPRFRFPELILFGCWAALLATPSVWAAPGEMNLRAVLIWGTNGSKPDDKKLKDVEPQTRQKLAAVFKWKDYYEVDRQNFKVPLSSKKRIRMSEKCEIEVENLGDATVDVKLFGEGRMVVRKKQALLAGELLVLAGEDKNDSAWFVVITPGEK